MSPDVAESRPRHPSHEKILWGLVAGAGAGVGANLAVAERPAWKSGLDAVIDAVAYPIGQVFLRTLFVVVIPLVFASLTLGVASLGDLGKLGRLGWRTLAFFLASSALSAVLGIGALALVRPGAGFDPAQKAELMARYAGDAAGYAAKSEETLLPGVLGVANPILDAFLPRNLLKAVTEMQMIPLIVFALLLGAALTGIEERRRSSMVTWLEALSEAMVRVVGFAMKLAPPAVFCLIFSVTARFGAGLLASLGLYVAVVFACYAIQLGVLYPLALRTLARRAPIDFMRKAMPVMVTAFSTSSSSATLPTSIRVAQQGLGIRPAVAGFVLPLGATMNMNGTALFEGAVVLFVAQVFGVDLSLADRFLVVALAVLTSIGAAGVPGGSLPLLMVVMAQVGVPPDGIAIVLGVDRVLDMGRTVVNVMGDQVCAAYVETAEARSSARGA